MSMTKSMTKAGRSGPEIFRCGLWMTLVAYVVVLLVALPYWSVVGEPLVVRSGG